MGRLTQAADFQRLLATSPCSRSAHFAVHHVAARPLVPRKPSVHLSSTDLSTESTTTGDVIVDNSPDRHWLGSVIPKRHARGAVTRNLLRRQIREAVSGQRERLPCGLWLVRLRAPFGRDQFPSAASDALRQAARDELAQLLGRAAARGRQV